MTHILDIMPKGDLSDLSWSFRNEVWPVLKMLCYAVAGILGLVAGVKVYNDWNIHGRAHIHIDAEVIAWAAAAVFLLVATTFINVVLL